MRIFAIGDLHLEGGTGKTMDRFGENWRDHDRKIFDSWDRVGREDDLLLLVGDISWAMRLDEAMPDLERIGRMKGLKLLLKGNHDYWWPSASKLARVLHPSIKPIQGSYHVTNRIAFVGTRGWLCPGDSYFDEGKDLKTYEREFGRLKTALESLAACRGEFDRLVVAMHYPPVNDRHESSGFTDLIEQYDADVCVYGHLHGEGIRGALTGHRGKTYYQLVSADSVDFQPAPVNLH